MALSGFGTFAATTTNAEEPTVRVHGLSLETSFFDIEDGSAVQLLMRPDFFAPESGSLEADGSFTYDFGLTVGLATRGSIQGADALPTQVALTGRLDFTEGLVTGTVEGVLPAELPQLAGQPFVLDLVCRQGATSRLRTRFSLDGAPHPAKITISDGQRILAFDASTGFDELVPSNATYQLAWTVNGTTKTDIIKNLRIPPGGEMELDFQLFDPDAVGLLNPVVFAQEAGANASILAGVTTLPGDQVRIEGDVQGEPGKLVILDFAFASQNGPTYVVEDEAVPLVALPGKNGIPNKIFFCAHCNGQGLPPTVPPENPGPPEPDPGAGGQSCTLTSSACSTTGCEPGTSCTADENECSSIDPSGTLPFSTVLRALEPDDSRIFLASHLRNARETDNGVGLLYDAVSGDALTTLTSRRIRVPRGQYVYSIAVPSGEDPRDSYRIAYPIDTSDRQFSQFVATTHPAEDFQHFVPLVTGDTSLGQSLRILGTTVDASLVTIDVVTRSTGWISLPYETEQLDVDEIRVILAGGGMSSLEEGPGYWMESMGDLDVLTMRVPSDALRLEVGFNLIVP